MNKSEQKIRNQVSEIWSSIYGSRMTNAARKLQEKGLIVFENETRFHGGNNLVQGRVKKPRLLPA